MPADTKVPFHGVAVDHAAEGEHVPRLGAKYYVTYVHRAFDSSRLVRTFKVPGERVAILYQVNRVRAGFAIVAFGVEGPGAGHIRRRAVLR